MKLLSQPMQRLLKTVLVIHFIVFSGFALSNVLTPIIDDFNNGTKNNIGIERLFITDQTVGGTSTNEVQIIDGVMQVKGKLVPPRGQPAWVSSVLPLDQQNNPQDVSKYKGVRLLIKVNKGIISLSANSTKVTNFDYHTALVNIPNDGQYHQIDIPFNTMKRTWSEQTKLDLKTLVSLSIVAFSIQPSTYEFELDQVSFY